MRGNIERLIKENNVNIMMIKSSVKTAEQYIDREEEILFIERANNKINGNAYAGIFIITNRKVLHVFKLLFEEKSNQIEYNQISSYNIDKGLMMTNLKINTNGNTLSLDFGNKKDLNIKIREALEKCKNYNQSQNIIINKDDIVTKLQKLSDLHREGILTEYEYSIKKQELLNKV